MPARQPAVDETAIRTVEHALLARLEGEVPADDRAFRQQPLIQDVGAQVHVVMAVEAARVAAIQPAEFVDLRRDDVFERSRQRGVEHELRQPVAAQIRGDPALLFHQPRRTVGRGERRREIQV